MGFRGLMWWIDRWRKSTAYTDMTLEEQGAYRNLLDEATLRGGALPNDERILAKACGDATRWKRVRAAIMPRLQLREDGLHHETLDEVLWESQRRAAKQAAYRDRKRGNESGNGHGNAEGHERDNKRGSPDPDQERASTDQKLSTRGRVFVGERLKVSKAQHEHLCDELGTMAGHIDLLALYPRWDEALAATGEEFDTLEYIKRRAKEAVKALRRGGPLYAEPEGDWFEECQQLHAGSCGGRVNHATRMQIDAVKATGTTG